MKLQLLMKSNLRSANQADQRKAPILPLRLHNDRQAHPSTTNQTIFLNFPTPITIPLQTIKAETNSKATEFLHWICLAIKANIGSTAKIQCFGAGKYQITTLRTIWIRWLLRLRCSSSVLTLQFQLLSSTATILPNSACEI